MGWENPAWRRPCFCAVKGAQVTVSDVRSAEALAKDIPALLEEGIMVEAGGHGLLTFRRQDLIVVSPGVPLDTPELEQVKGFGLPIIGEVELAARFLKEDPGHHRLQRQDHHDGSGRRDSQEGRAAYAGWRQHRRAGD